MSASSATLARRSRNFRTFGAQRCVCITRRGPHRETIRIALPGPPPAGDGKAKGHGYSKLPNSRREGCVPCPILAYRFARLARRRVDHRSDAADVRARPRVSKFLPGCRRIHGRPAPDLASQSGLILASDGYLYGTSYWGGSSGVGTIFRIDPSGGLTTVHSFAYADGANPAAALVEAADGNLYGTTTRGGQERSRYDLSGWIARAPLRGCTASPAWKARTRGPPSSRPATETLYGTTTTGGGGNVGTLFKIGSDGTFTKLHIFHRYTDGAHPAGRLLQTTDGYLYGTTVEGGTNNTHNVGTVFRVDIATNSLITIHVFDGSDGARPYAGLIEATDGNLYGTTSGHRRVQRDGTVYKIDASGVLTTVYTFGDGPYAELIQATDLLFYGTTSAGTIFQLDPSGTLTVLHSPNGERSESVGRNLDGSRPGGRWQLLRHDQRLAMVFEPTRTPGHRVSAGLYRRLHHGSHL